MSGGKIIPVIAQGDRELSRRAADLEDALVQVQHELKYNDAELFRQVDDIRVEARAGLADLVAFVAELRKRIEKLEHGEAPKLNG